MESSAIQDLGRGWGGSLSFGVVSAPEQRCSLELGPWHGGDHSPIDPTMLLHLFTAGIMLVSNLTMGLYIHFVPASQNGTITNKTLVSSANLPAEPTNYITLIPLLATMFFIMGTCRGQELRTYSTELGAGCQPGGDVSHLRQGDAEQGDEGLELEGRQMSLEDQERWHLKSL